MLTTTITFAGNLAADPELRYTTQGTPVADFTVMVNRRVKDGDQWKDDVPTNHACKIYGKEAENFVESIAKGARVLVHGTVRTESWVDKETRENRYRDLVVVEEIGASMKWATVNVTRASRNTQDQANTQPGAQPTPSDPWSTSPGN